MAFPGTTGSPLGETLSGSTADDVFDALGGTDWLDGLAGNDNLSGGDDDDTLIGQDGSDTLSGGAGRDLIWGGTGDDHLLGGAGQDTLQTDGGADLVEGGADDDYLHGIGGQSTLFGDGGDDVFFLDGLDDQAHGGEGNDSFVVGTSGYTTRVALMGDAGDDRFHFSLAAAGSVDGGAGGQDSLHLFWYDATNRLAAVTLTPTLATIGSQTLVIADIESFDITANAGNDSITTGDGNDRVVVLEGANHVVLGGGDDRAHYVIGSANDLDGGAGIDTLNLGARGALALDFHVTAGVVDDGHGSRIVDFERFEVTGTNFGDDISLGDGDDLARLGRGRDTAQGGGGQDTLNGGWENDSLSGGSGNDDLIGAQGSDLLYGDEGNDRLFLGIGSDVGFGGAGNDRVIFQAGGHTGWGDAGRDLFVFRVVDEAYEWIGDFTPGEDRLAIASDALAGLPGPGPVSASLMTQGSLTTEAPQFLQYTILSHNYLFWDPDGTGAQDASLIAIFLNGATLRAQDIWLI